MTDAERIAAYSSKELQSKIRRLLNDNLKLCGCGSGTAHQIVFEALERAESGGSFYRQMGDICPRAVEFIAHVLDGAGLLEHGGSIGYAWLTDDGKLILQFLRDFGTDPGGLGEGHWPAWWCSCGAGEEW